MGTLDHYPLLAEPEIDTHRGFILAEEAALKDYLTGIEVPSVPRKEPPEPPIKVGVWYRFPEGERQLKYPFIIIDLINVEPAYDLFHSMHYERPDDGPYEPLTPLYRPDFSPLLPPPPSGTIPTAWNVLNYLPFRLTFQVSTYARSNLHDRFLTSIFMTDIFPVRPNYIRCAVDDTWRRVENLGMVQNNMPETTESGTKRIFRKFWTITMQASVPQNLFTEEGDWRYQVMRVLIFGVDMPDFVSFYEKFLHNQPDPLNDFTDEERREGGEFFHIVHEAPPASPPP
jgi:hypothetical protein